MKNDYPIYCYTPNHNSNMFTQLIENLGTHNHKHNCFEVFYLTKGSTKHVYNGKSEILSTNSLLILRPSDVHMFSPTPDAECIRRDVLFPQAFFKDVCDFLSPALYSKILSENDPPRVNVSDPMVKELEELLSKNIATSLDKDVCDARIKSCLVYILSLFLNLITDNQNVPPFITQLLVELNDKKNLCVSTQEIMKNYYYNETYLRKTFKKYVGTTISQYHLTVKLQQAYQLIVYSNQTIEEISALCGFNNPSYFYKAYKKYYGCTPHKSKNSSDDKA